MKNTQSIYKNFQDWSQLKVHKGQNKIPTFKAALSILNNKKVKVYLPKKEQEYFRNMNLISFKITC